jgi:hypothetical protein
MAALHGYWEEDGEEKSKKRKRRKKGRGAWRPGEVSRGFFSSSRRQAGGGQRQPSAGHAAASSWKKKKMVFAENPLGFGGFLGNIKTGRFCKLR